MHDDRLARLVENVERQFGIVQADMQLIRAAVMARQGKAIVLDQVVNGDGALMLLIRIAAADRGVVERDIDQAVGLLISGMALRLFKAQGDGQRMGVKALRLAERHRRRPDGAQAFRRTF